MTLDEDTTGTIALTAIDDHSSFTFEVISHPANGVATVKGSALSFIPRQDWNGKTSLTYRAQDPAGAWSAPATVSITVIPVNDIPVSYPVSVSIPEDTVATIKLPVYDVDLFFEGDSHTFEIIGTLDPKEGRYSLSGDVLTVTPAQDWNGTLNLQYRAIDSHGAKSNVSPVSVEVTYVNDPPVATGATIVTKEGMESDHVEPWVEDVDIIYGDVHTFEIVEQPSHGVAKLVFNKLEYKPNYQYFGSDSFIIRATDREGESVEGVVDVTVEKFNYAPTDILPGSLKMYAGIGGTAELTAVDPNTWGSHTFEVVEQPASGKVTISGNTLTLRTDDDRNTTVRVRVVDQGGLSYEKNISLEFASAWEMFKDRAVEHTTANPRVPAVLHQMTTRSGSYAFQVNDKAIIAALGKDIIAIVTPDSAVGVTLEHRELAQGIGMRLIPTKADSTLLEARLGGLNVGVDGDALVYLSRADLAGPVYSVPVKVWAPEGDLKSDAWEVLQGSGRTQISFAASNSACSVFTSEAVAKQQNALQDAPCFFTWTQTPDEWRNASMLSTLMMDAAGNAVGDQLVEATAFVIDRSDTKHEIAKFTRNLKVMPVADQISFSLKPDLAEAYQKVQQVSLLLRHNEGPTCEATANETLAKKAAQQWTTRPSCLIRWMQVPDGLQQQSNYGTPLLEGAFSVQGANSITWVASLFTPSGKEVQIGYGQHTTEVIQPPAIEIAMPSTNKVKDGMYWVSQLGGYVGSASITSIAASLNVAISRDDEQIENSTVPSYGRSQRFSRYVEGSETPLWSIVPYSIDVGYSALPQVRTTESTSLLAVPHDGIRPVILNDERRVLDTVSLPIRVAIKDTRYMEDGYRVSAMGDWDVRLMSTTVGTKYEPMTDWEPIDENGEVEFETDLHSLTNKAVRVIAEARVRSPVPEYELVRQSPSPMVLSVLNGEALDGSIQALRIIGPAPLRTFFYAVTNDRFQTGDLGEVRWEMSKDGGTTWEQIENDNKMPQRLSRVFPRGTYHLRAELTNRHSGAKSMTPIVEVIAYVVPVARLKGPANVFIADTGTFKLTDIKGEELDTTGMVVEWSEDRGKTWLPGEGTYKISRDKAERVYLTARVKYTDSPEDKRVYKTLRAGVAFRPVRPPRVQIIGPRRPEVGGDFQGSCRVSVSRCL